MFRTSLPCAVKPFDIHFASHAQGDMHLSPSSWTTLFLRALRKSSGEHSTSPKVRPPHLGLTTALLTHSCTYIILLSMSITERTETVRFTTKGQVVIPLRLRKQFEIESGTRAVVQATAEGIILKPLTAALIKRGRGILKRKPGEKPLAEEWAEHRRHERELEERHAR